jgi:predicted DNA-binding transcriptional regulator
MDKINKILQNFAFSQSESELYTAALKLEKASISEIAQKAGMGRTVAYFHIKNLIKRNIFKQVKTGKKIVISAISPTELAENLQERVGDFKTMIPQLEALGRIENEIPQIEIMESNAAFQKIYDEVVNMPVGSSWKVFEDRAGGEAEMKLLDNEYWNKFFSQMLERKIITKAIFSSELLSDINKSITPENYNILGCRLWNIRKLPEDKMPINGLVLLYNGKLSFLFPEVALTITIKHSALFHLLDTMFETIFSFAEIAENPWGKSAEKDSPTKQVPQKATEEDLYY